MRNKIFHIVVVAIVLAGMILGAMPIASLAWGAAPGIDQYNTYVSQLHAMGCRFWYSSIWGDSYWQCPDNHVYRLRLNQLTDSASLTKVR